MQFFDFKTAALRTCTNSSVPGYSRILVIEILVTRLLSLEPLEITGSSNGTSAVAATQLTTQTQFKPRKLSTSEAILHLIKNVAQGHLESNLLAARDFAGMKVRHLGHSYTIILTGIDTSSLNEICRPYTIRNHVSHWYSFLDFGCRHSVHCLSGAR